MAFDRNHRLAGIVDSSGHRVDYGYNLGGQRDTMTVPDTGTVEYSYTPRGSVEFLTDPDGRIAQLEYNDGGKLKSIIYPNGRVVNYEYNAIGQIARTWFDPQTQSPYGQLAPLTESQFESGIFPTGAVE